MLHAIIMAGGAGTRFWPESRAARPKQLLDFASGRTMLQATVDRLGKLFPPQRVLVVTNQSLVEPIARQLPQLPAAAVHVLAGRLPQLGQDAAAVQGARDLGAAVPGRALEIDAIDLVERDHVQHPVFAG